MVSGNDGSTNQSASIGRERVVSMDDAKATTFKENKTLKSKENTTLLLWRRTQARTQSGSSHKPGHDARPRPGDAQSAPMAVLA